MKRGKHPAGDGEGVLEVCARVPAQRTSTAMWPKETENFSVCRCGLKLSRQTPQGKSRMQSNVCFQLLVPHCSSLHTLFDCRLPRFLPHPAPIKVQGLVSRLGTSDSSLKPTKQEGSLFLSFVLFGCSEKRPGVREENRVIFQVFLAVCARVGAV